MTGKHVFFSKGTYDIGDRMRVFEISAGWLRSFLTTLENFERCSLTFQKAHQLAGPRVISSD